MNVVILTPDRVGSTLLQRVLTVYMLVKEFDKPVINLHELTNGLGEYYNTTLNQIVLGKLENCKGYHQSLPEIIELLKSADHYKTSRLAHYHINRRQDSINDQLKFYDYLNENFYIISCRRDNLLEHAISWCIVAHTKTLNVYSAMEKYSKFNELYKNKISIQKEQLYKYLEDYKKYIEWSDRYFNVQSYFNYDKDVNNIENYILNLDIMNNHSKNSWTDMFDLSFNEYNTCRRILPNLMLHEQQNSDKFLEFLEISNISKTQWNILKGVDWPEYENADFSNLPDIIKNDFPTIFKKQTLNLQMDTDTYNFLNVFLKKYTQADRLLSTLVTQGFLVSNIPVKLQSLKEKKDIIQNFQDVIVWYNQWVDQNEFGIKYTVDDLDSILEKEEDVLTSLIKHRLN